MFGDLPKRLHECFYDWISIYNLPKGGEIPNLQPKVVRLGWQTKDNWIDCGIYVMRHMETYMGSLYGWRVGLRADDNAGAFEETAHDILSQAANMEHE